MTNATTADFAPTATDRIAAWADAALATVSSDDFVFATYNTDRAALVGAALIAAGASSVIGGHFGNAGEFGYIFHVTSGRTGGTERLIINSHNGYGTRVVGLNGRPGDF